jgi:leader peptidase (prepilin peptidase)/N-methyltransferase
MLTVTHTASTFWLLSAFAVVTGACVGSFLNVVVWRLPRQESLMRPGSHCPTCGHAIRPWENIPVLSWLLLRARCSSCGASISWRYPVGETATAVVFWFLWWRVWTQHGVLEVYLAHAVLASALLALATIDIEHGLLPDRITLPLILAALALAVVLPASHPVTWPLFTDSVAAGPDLHFWSRGLCEALLAWIPEGGGRARPAALLDAVFGGTVGYAFLWAVAEIGHLAWGRSVGVPLQPTPVDLTGGELRIDDGVWAWDDLLVRPHDRARFTVGAAGEIHLALQSGEQLTVPASTLTVTHGGIRTENTEVPWGDVERCSFVADRWVLPREVLGGGDPKMLAMIGAFLGPEATVFVVFLGAVGGTLVGLAGFAMGRGRQWLAFGPFLALGTLLWMGWGPQMIAAYGRMALRFHGGLGVP